MVLEKQKKKAKEEQEKSPKRRVGPEKRSWLGEDYSPIIGLKLGRHLRCRPNFKPMVTAFIVWNTQLFSVGVDSHRR